MKKEEQEKETEENKKLLENTKQELNSTASELRSSLLTFEDIKNAMIELYNQEENLKKIKEKGNHALKKRLLGKRKPQIREEWSKILEDVDKTQNILKEAADDANKNIKKLISLKQSDIEKYEEEIDIAFPKPPYLTANAHPHFQKKSKIEVLEEIENEYNSGNEMNFYEMFYLNVLANSPRYFTSHKFLSYVPDGFQKRAKEIASKNILFNSRSYVKKLKDKEKELEQHLKDLNSIIREIKEGEKSLNDSKISKFIKQEIWNYFKESLTSAQEKLDKGRKKHNECQEKIKEAVKLRKKLSFLHAKYDKIHRRISNIEYLRKKKGFYFFHGISLDEKAIHLNTNNKVDNVKRDLIERLEYCFKNKNILLSVTPYLEKEHKEQPRLWSQFGIVISKGILEGTAKKDSKALHQFIRTEISYKFDGYGKCNREVAVRLKKIGGLFIWNDRNFKLILTRTQYENFIRLLKENPHLKFYLVTTGKGISTIKKKEFLEYIKEE